MELPLPVDEEALFGVPINRSDAERRFDAGEVERVTIRKVLGASFAKTMSHTGR